MSLFLSLVLFAVAFFMGRWSDFFAVSAVSWLVLSSAGIWFALGVQFHQRRLAEQEQLDMGRLAGDGGAPNIFAGRSEQQALFAVARRRLEVLEKWFLPIYAVLLAVYQAVLGIYLLRKIQGFEPVRTEQPFLVCAVAMTAIAFVSFLVSRYATGMSAQVQWKPLRAAGSSMLAVAAVCFVLAIGLAVAHLFQFYAIVRVVDYAVGLLLIVVALETAMNVVLDIYRPRIKGQYSRAAFDSRLLGVINEPGGIFRSAADAIDYQFGFQVSQTWFYKLLEKAVLPLFVFGVVTLYLMSCIVVVAPDEEAIVEHFGNPRDASGEVRLLGPGLAFKWPWPIDKVRAHPTRRLQEIYVGFEPEIDKQTGEVVQEKELLWGKKHYKEEYPLLVATHYSGDDAAGGVPVGLINANVPVQYRVKDLYAYIYNHRDPEPLLSAICHNELARFAAGSTVDIEERQGTEDLSLLGGGRTRARQVLTEAIQTAADAKGLGIEIVFLGLQGLHPTVEVAKDYQAVVGAVQEEQALILNAQAQRNSTLSSVAGSVGDADALYELAARYQRAQADEQQLQVLAPQLDRAFAEARGDIFQTLRQAQSYAFEKSVLAAATGRRFASQVQAHEAAPRIYRQEQRLRALIEALRDVRKYVVVPGRDNSQIFRIDLKEKLTPDLYDFGNIQEISGQ
ncbi:MAG TPA: hypothetical protein ENN81_01330 [Phycisphaerales bacterium]|nr:hypothetical protein [Phycisphaerales bacterium]